jgi:hypothetical protein
VFFQGPVAVGNKRTGIDDFTSGDEFDEVVYRCPVAGNKEALDGLQCKGEIRLKLVHSLAEMLRPKRRQKPPFSDVRNRLHGIL